MSQAIDPSSSNDQDSVDQSVEKKHNQTIFIRQRMLKVQQRELLISNTRQNYCVTSKRSSDHVSSLTSPKIEPSLFASFIPESSQQKHKSESVNEAEMKKSREFIKKLKKITRDSYGKRRKSPPLSDQLRDLSNRVASLDMEWNDFGTVLNTTGYLRKLLSIERNPPIEQVILSGAVPYLLQSLDSNQVKKFFNIGKLDGDSGKQSISLSNLHHLQFEAAWAITNIASGNPDHTRYVVELGCIPALINLLDSESNDVKEQCVWALGNISGDSITMRNLVLDNGAMPKVLKIFELSKINLTRNAAWTLSNLLRGKPLVPFEIVSTALPVLSHLLFHSDEEVLSDACWAISYASDGPDERVQAVIDVGITRRVVELLQHHSSMIQTPALRIVGNLVTGTDYQTSIVLNCGLLNNLQPLLLHTKKSIRKEVLWTISNITAGNKHQIQMVIDTEIIPKVIAILTSTSEAFEVKKEAYWVLANLCENGNIQQIKYAIEKGVVEPFCNGIKVKDAKIIEVALEGLKCIIFAAKELNILESVINEVKECGAMNKIFELRNSKNQITQEIATQILENLIEQKLVQEL